MGAGVDGRESLVIRGLAPQFPVTLAHYPDVLDDALFVGADNLRLLVGDTDLIEHLLADVPVLCIPPKKRRRCVVNHGGPDAGRAFIALGLAATRRREVHEEMREPVVHRRVEYLASELRQAPAAVVHVGGHRGELVGQVAVQADWLRERLRGGLLNRVIVGRPEERAVAAVLPLGGLLYRVRRQIRCARDPHGIGPATQGLGLVPVRGLHRVIREAGGVYGVGH